MFENLILKSSPHSFPETLHIFPALYHTYNMCLSCFNQICSFFKHIAYFMIMTAMIDNFTNFRGQTFSNLLLWQFLNCENEVIRIKLRDFFKSTYFMIITYDSGRYFIITQFRFDIKFFFCLYPFFDKLLWYNNRWLLFDRLACDVWQH